VKGSWPLLLAITVVWAVVWAITQVAASSPLAATPSIAIGLSLTLLVVWGYPSVLRGPRRLGRLSAAAMEPAPGEALEIVTRTLPYLRDGLTERTASRSARLLLPLTAGSAVAITDTDEILGFAGRGTGPEVLGYTSRRAMDLGRTVLDTSGEWVEVSAPLVVEQETVGSLLVRYPEGSRPSVSQLEGVAGLVSLQLELADLTRKAQSAADAKLQALRAQINPHFLFNTLNTIAAKSRTDPDETRQLLQRLADFFRYSIQQEGQYAEFAHEYFFVRTYLSLEKARYEERLNLHYDVDPQVLPAQVPVLTIQPLVENAVKHGLAPKAGGGTVSLKARVDPLAGSIKIQVRDDGLGMEPEVLRRVVAGEQRSESGGVALRNIHERLEGLYGSRYRFDVRSSPGKGTRVELDLPL
jgi:two-component system LytT family sensor kinase